MEKYRGVRTEEGKGKYRWEINKILALWAGIFIYKKI